jgi:hypothetical protein
MERLGGQGFSGCKGVEGGREMSPQAGLGNHRCHHYSAHEIPPQAGLGNHTCHSHNALEVPSQAGLKYMLFDFVSILYFSRGEGSQLFLLAFLLEFLWIYALYDLFVLGSRRNIY